MAGEEDSDRGLLAQAEVGRVVLAAATIHERTGFHLHTDVVMDWWRLRQRTREQTGRTRLQNGFMPPLPPEPELKPELLLDPKPEPPAAPPLRMESRSSVCSSQPGPTIPSMPRLM